ncbi:MAG: GNAT family N-acetyltransferase [Anaerolineales bacterium]
MKSDQEVTHNTEKGRFELNTDGHLAMLNYMRMGEIITFTHTGVPSAIENRGLGSKLVETGLNYARENGLKVRSTCWFVSKYIRRHAEYQDLLK